LKTEMTSIGRSVGASKSQPHEVISISDNDDEPVTSTTSEPYCSSPQNVLVKARENQFASHLISVRRDSPEHQLFDTDPLSEMQTDLEIPSTDDPAPSTPEVSPVELELVRLFASVCYRRPAFGEDF